MNPRSSQTVGVREGITKLVAVLGFFVVWTVLYGITNDWGSAPVRAHCYPSPISVAPWLFQPWAAVIYVFGGWATLVLPFLVQWNTGRLLRVIESMAIACGMSLVAYFAWPVVIVRPDYDGADVGHVLMRWFTSIDQPANTFPSGHTLFAVMAGLWIHRGPAARWLRVGGWALAVSVAASTILVGQHYFWDVPGGAVVAWLGYWISNRRASKLVDTK